MLPLSGGAIRPMVRWVRQDPVKLTALLYLREALLKEKYEDCAVLVTEAKQLGADAYEIQDILENPQRLAIR